MGGDRTEGGSGARPPRRPRYPGTHPRRFQDKYKERDPARWPGLVAHVEAAGRTPAGGHRPICVDEILAILDPRPGEVAVDATLGHAGHALAVLPRLRPGGRLIGIDADPLELPRAESRLREAGFGTEEAVAVHSNMAALPRVLAEAGLSSADLVVADLGCSSMQLDDPSRGFSYKREGPLDLRMNPRKGRPAAELLRDADAARVAGWLRDHSDEPRAEEIAAAIVAARPLTTLQLARAVAGALPPSADIAATQARVFQALRIEVNGEASALETFLRALPSCLAPGGRVAILTFHSGEDRRVKRAFAEGWRAGDYAEIAREVVRPSRAEVRANPRAGSAKLRWARKA